MPRRLPITVAAVLATTTLAVAPLAAQAMSSSGSIEGTVTGSGLNVHNMTIYVEKGRVYEDARVKADGSFQIDGLPSGTYRGSISYDGQDDSGWDEIGDIAVSEGGIAHLDLSYVTITGHVTAGGNSFSDGGVAMWDEGTTFGSAWDGLDESGNYLLFALADDKSHYLQFQPWETTWAQEFYDDAPTVAQATPLSLNEGNLTGIDASLSEGSTLKGKVQLPSRVKSADTAVHLLDENGAVINYDAQAGGSFKFAGLPVGSYLLSFARASGEALTIGSYLDGVTEAEGIGGAEVIEITEPGQTVSVAGSSISEGAATVKGKIVGRNGGRARLRVVAVPTTDGLTTRSARTKKSGKYAITGLSPGSYELYVWNSDYPSPSSRKCKQKHFGGIEVTEGQTASAGRAKFTAKTSKRC